MAVADFTTLVSGMSFTECPRWRDGRLYFSDLYSDRVLAVGMDGSLETLAHVAGQPAGLGFMPDGSLLMVSQRERRIWRREVDGLVTLHADLNSLAPWHLNDLIVDNDGRAFVGNFGFDLMGGEPACTTVLIAVEPDGSARVVADGLGFPNGMVITPDGGTLIVAETTMSRLSAFDVTGGSLGERRTWAAFGDEPTSTEFEKMIGSAVLVPDGICLDAEGAVWVADTIHNRLVRVAEGGKILEEIKTGVAVFACMLGGEDGRALFACLAPSYIASEASANHRASVVMTRVRVPHGGLP
jgi:sugar lactone lactonase YvrE